MMCIFGAVATFALICLFGSVIDIMTHVMSPEVAMVNDMLTMH